MASGTSRSKISAAVRPKIILPRAGICTWNRSSIRSADTEQAERSSISWPVLAICTAPRPWLWISRSKALMRKSATAMRCSRVSMRLVGSPIFSGVD